eukprot:scaffold10220_cov148-Cylindrotheca_fusiformis.AAC.1
MLDNNAGLTIIATIDETLSIVMIFADDCCFLGEVSAGQDLRLGSPPKVPNGVEIDVRMQ